jgi:hypothetical protein
MQTNFGKTGSYYYWISRGVDNREVRADRIRKSVGAEKGNSLRSPSSSFPTAATSTPRRVTPMAGREMT